MATYQDRKAARRKAFIANQGKPQPRRVFRVYASNQFNDLPQRFATVALGAFSSRKEAEAFVNEFGPGTAWGSDAEKALAHMISRDEWKTLAEGWEKYTSFKIASEEV